MNVANLETNEEEHVELERDKANIRSVKTWLPARRLAVAVLGSSTFYSSISPSLCRYLGEALWSCGITLATSGTLGIAELVAWSYTFFGEDSALNSAFHFVQNPEKQIGYCVERSDIGLVVAAGRNEEEHLDLVSKICPIYILIEGGPHAAKLAKKALENGAIVIPIGRTGGAASGLFDVPEIPKPHSVPNRVWKALTDDTLDVRDTVRCIISILGNICQAQVESIG